MTYKIMIVDDDILLLKTLHACFTKYGYSVKTFTSGIDAVKSLFEEKPDILILDILLNDCDGWFVAKVLRKLYEQNCVKLIIISVLDEDYLRMRELRPEAYIKKPFDMGNLFRVIERCLPHTVVV